jgi:two-component system, LytTR family, response regulator
MEPFRIKALIIDDEPIACRRIRRMLRDDQQIEIIGESSDGQTALQMIQKHSPDLLFLDVQMPEMDGFEVLKALGNDRIPNVIFVTAYDIYALRAFEFYALDYLLKPFDRERFERAVSHAKDKILKDRKGSANVGLLSLLEELRGQTTYQDRLMIRREGRVVFLKTRDIDWIEAEGKYVYLHLGKESVLLREGITKMETALDPARFIRIHRSTIVNVDRVQELHPWFRRDYRVILRDGTQLMMTGNYRQNLQRAFGKPL